jgi:hypothetical protein
VIEWHSLTLKGSSFIYLLRRNIMFKNTGNIKKSIFIFLSFMLLLTSLGFNHQTAQAATCTQFHTAKRGEYLYMIGKMYGVSWRTLAEINDLKDPSRIYPGQKLCISEDGSPTNPSPGTTPTFSIVSVDKDKSVTIKTSDFPAKDSFDVRMGVFGTKGINGKLIETIDSGKGGTFTANFKIPVSLQGSERIAIRLESNTGSKYFAYNWFYNNTSGSNPGNPSNGYTGFPTFTIVNVARNDSVTIKTSNLPKNDTFDVYMGKIGTRGLNGIKVDTTSSGEGGSQTLTYKIPEKLKGEYQIAIRMQSSTSGYFAYNWFYNNTTK